MHCGKQTFNMLSATVWALPVTFFSDEYQLSNWHECLNIHGMGYVIITDDQNNAYYTNFTVHFHQRVWVLVMEYHFPYNVQDKLISRSELNCQHRHATAVSDILKVTEDVLMDYNAHSVFQQLHDYSSLILLSRQDENEHQRSFSHTQSQNCSECCNRISIIRNQDRLKY